MKLPWKRTVRTTCQVARPLCGTPLQLLVSLSATHGYELLERVILTPSQASPTRMRQNISQWPMRHLRATWSKHAKAFAPPIPDLVGLHTNLLSCLAHKTTSLSKLYQQIYYISMSSTSAYCTPMTPVRSLRGNQYIIVA